MGDDFIRKKERQIPVYQDTLYYSQFKIAIVSIRGQ